MYIYIDLHSKHFTLYTTSSVSLFLLIHGARCLLSFLLARKKFVLTTFTLNLLARMRSLLQLLFHRVHMILY